MENWPTGVRAINADCLRTMRLMAVYGVEVDSIVTDPPYHLTSIVKRFGSARAEREKYAQEKSYSGYMSRGFMGKQWDGGDIAADPETWALAYDVLKPGGHLVAFGGTRTYHRMVCAIEDAGFEIRDQLAWMFGSGFPKSHDVNKGIDRMDAGEQQERRRLRFTSWVRSTGTTSQKINKATGTNMGSHYTTAASQPSIMTREHLEACRHLLGDIPAWVERECDIRSVESRNFAEREKIGETVGIKGSHFAPGISENKTALRDITAPATEAAREWEGWGTALKPAHEPICLARKPLSEKSVAANVLEHGTGAVNVDGCRVGDESTLVKRPPNSLGRMNDDGWQPKPGMNGSDKGRWPANVLHDGSDEVVGMFPQTGQMGTGTGTGSGGIWSPSTGEPAGPQHGDSGSAARFFYSSKAGPDDRYGSKHPTVKPVSLMRWLVRLVTPPGGLVLDPFAGTGSTGIACLRESMRAILIEREAEYFADIKSRLAALDGSDQPLFTGIPAQLDIEGTT